MTVEADISVYTQKQITDLAYMMIEPAIANADPSNFTVELECRREQHQQWDDTVGHVVVEFMRKYNCKKELHIERGNMTDRKIEIRVNFI